MEKKEKSEIEKLRAAFHIHHPEHRCAHCRQEIAPIRSTKKYCGGTCRAKACLLRKKNRSWLWRFYNYIRSKIFSYGK